MKSEALRNIRTLRQARISGDILRDQNIRTTNSLSKTEEELSRLNNLSDRRTASVLEKERQRLKKQEASVEKSRQQLLKSRVKLAKTINMNRALNNLRHEIQKERWEAID
jgi:predicted  nucleic acid-binding Zn-ribbon protein